MPGDEIHPERTGKIFPDPGDVPSKYLPLLEWAKKRYEEGRLSEYPASEPSPTREDGRDKTQPEKAERWLESLFQLQGLGKELWKDVDPDEYVRQLREGWE